MLPLRCFECRRVSRYCWMRSFWQQQKAGGCNWCVRVHGRAHVGVYTTSRMKSHWPDCPLPHLVRKWDGITLHVCNRAIGTGSCLVTGIKTSTSFQHQQQQQWTIMQSTARFLVAAVTNDTFCCHFAIVCQSSLAVNFHTDARPVSITLDTTAKLNTSTKTDLAIIRLQ